MKAARPLRHRFKSEVGGAATRVSPAARNRRLVRAAHNFWSFCRSLRERVGGRCLCSSFHALDRAIVYRRVLRVDPKTGAARHRPKAGATASRRDGGEEAKRRHDGHDRPPQKEPSRRRDADGDRCVRAPLVCPPPSAPSQVLPCPLRERLLAQCPDATVVVDRLPRCCGPGAPESGSVLCGAGWSMSCAVATTRGAFKCRSGPSRPPPPLQKSNVRPRGPNSFFHRHNEYLGPLRKCIPTSLQGPPLPRGRANLPRFGEKIETIKRRGDVNRKDTGSDQ